MILGLSNILGVKFLLRSYDSVILDISEHLGIGFSLSVLGACVEAVPSTCSGCNFKLKGTHVICCAGFLYHCTQGVLVNPYGGAGVVASLVILLLLLLSPKY